MSRFRAALVAVCATGAALVTAGCAAGQVAQTADERPTLDGTYGQVGKIKLEGVAFHAPSGPSYPSGSSVPLAAYIVNDGQSADRLVKIESSSFTGGWDVVSTPSLLAGPSGAPTPTKAAGISNGRPQTIPAGSAIDFGLQNLSASGAGSPESLVLLGLGKDSSPLFPGTALKVTFTFANAGQTTLTVPVQLSTKAPSASVPAESGSAAG